MNMQGCILLSNSGKISHSLFCDSMGLLLTFIISLYCKPSFTVLSPLQTVSSLKAGNSYFAL